MVMRVYMRAVSTVNNKFSGSRIPCTVPEVRIAAAGLMRIHGINAQHNGIRTVARTRDTIKEVLEHPGPYPQIVLPAAGGYWMDGVSSCTISIDDEVVGQCSATSSCARSKLETDDTSHCYRRHFVGREHHDFYATDANLGPLVLSVRTELISSQDHFRIMLRTRHGTIHEIVPASGMFHVPRIIIVI
ncbi:unnamed protein product [Gongylonema pulchrum]|uniref:Rap-GAP domain-containing protein n=1 Tax=Gongylonema pulchrum TaxID=637853 RepID=A0A183D0C9_9BILA|nr:unnamed protein product [Gongylonema pulchrum]